MSLDDNLGSTDFQERTIPPHRVGTQALGIPAPVRALLVDLGAARTRIQAALDVVGVPVLPDVPSQVLQSSELAAALGEEVRRLRALADRLELDLVVLVKKAGPPPRSGWVRPLDRVASPLLIYGRTKFRSARMPEHEVVVLTKAEIEAW